LGDRIVTVNQLRTYFWYIDPGYFNLKQAIKTVLAILVALWWVWDQGALVQVVAGIVSGTSVQGVVAKSLYARLAHIVVFDAIYFSALALGFSLRGYPHWIAILLVVWGFAVNYIRRFGLDNSKAPIMAWILCLIATIIPIADTIEVWLLIRGVVTGLIISAIIILCVFPENYPRLFINNSNRFFQNLAQGLEEMHRYLFMPKQITDFANISFVSRKVTLEKLLSSNQLIQQSSVFASVEKPTGYILRHQYGLLNAYSLMIETYYALWRSKHQLSHEGMLALDYLNKEFERLFFSMKVESNYVVSSACGNSVLISLAKKLGRIPLTEPSIVMALLNFKLSFDLLNQHRTQLLRGVDET
jgi:hypothetical protein